MEEVKYAAKLWIKKTVYLCHNAYCYWCKRFDSGSIHPLVVSCIDLYSDIHYKCVYTYRLSTVICTAWASVIVTVSLPMKQRLMWGKLLFFPHMQYNTGVQMGTNDGVISVVMVRPGVLGSITTPYPAVHVLCEYSDNTNDAAVSKALAWCPSCATLVYRKYKCSYCGGHCVPLFRYILLLEIAPCLQLLTLSGSWTKEYVPDKLACSCQIMIRSVPVARWDS